MELTFEVEHVGGCNALCHDDRHYVIPDLVDASTAKPLGDGWVEVGYIEEGGIFRA